MKFRLAHEVEKDLRFLNNQSYLRQENIFCKLLEFNGDNDFSE